jgi:hypothetical protein
MSEYPSSVCFVRDYGEWKLFMSKVNRLFTSVDFKYANYFAMDFVVLILRVISTSLCYLGAREKA